jgi:hypothetical protein
MSFAVALPEIDNAVTAEKQSPSCKTSQITVRLCRFRTCSLPFHDSRCRVSFAFALPENEMRTIPTTLKTGSLLALALTGMVQAKTTEKPGLNKQPTLYVVGYAHLDTGWRWEYPQVIDESCAKPSKITSSCSKSIRIPSSISAGRTVTG